MLALPAATLRERAGAYAFRAFSECIRFGTASDRYAGWMGQIYPPAYEKRLSSRSRRLGGRSYQERTLPVESVRHYFEHFDVLEIDFTYYRPLLNADGSPSNNHFVLQQYAAHAPDDALFFLKAPQAYFTRTLRRTRGGETTYDENPDFLNAEGYTTLFHAPAREILGRRLAGILFEQSYQRVADSPTPEQNVAELDTFFAAIPGDVQLHIELRSPHLLTPSYFAWLESRRIGFVFSHWTWLPPLRRQWELCGGRFSAADRQAVVRLLTPLGMSYAEAYAQAYPFDKPVPEIVNSRQGQDMILDTTALALQACKQGATLNIIVNNRAWGNSPDLAQAIAYRILDLAAREPGSD